MQSRRGFLQTTGAMLAAGGILHAAPDWKKQVGLELFTVRDQLARDFEGTLARIAAIGYREVEPVDYNKLAPRAFRALLDKYKLTAPSTHAGATAGPDLEKELAGHQEMGFQYTEVRAARAGGGRGGAAARGPQQPRPPETEESVKRTAAQYNEYGRITKKFGMKILVHNHTQEFELLEGGKHTAYDILLAETDPALVAMQLDIGWASVAGQDIPAMFRRNPGRYELWHVKDAVGINGLEASLTPNQRRGKTRLVPVGQGEIDYRAIFALAGQAGLKHYCIEQDNAADSGDSVASAKTCYDGLLKVLG